MTDGVEAERIGAGTPRGADSEIEAVPIAAGDVDGSGPRLATVCDMPAPADVGRAGDTADDERRDWALGDRDAKILIGVMLTLQVMVLGALMWL